MIDAHCHLDSERLGTSPEEALARAREVGVEAIVMAGIEPAEWAAQRALVARLPEVYPVYGIHPQLVPELDDASLDAMLAALERDLTAHRPVALGETGLDRYGPETRGAIDLQARAFREQLRMAHRHDLPVVLHLLRADELALKILKDEKLPPRGGMVHSFSGSADFARQLLALGLHLSFSGPLTYPQSRRLREAAAITPAGRLLVETDSPDQSPHPHRGETNRPALLPLVVVALAEARAAPVEEVGALTADNARRLFGLRPP